MYIYVYVIRLSEQQSWLENTVSQSFYHTLFYVEYVAKIDKHWVSI